MDQVNTTELANGTITAATQRQIVVGAGFVDGRGHHIGDAVILDAE